MSQASHLAGVDIFGEGMSLAGPAFDKSLTEWRGLGYQLGVGDLDGATSAKLGELGGVEAFVVMVGGALRSIRFRNHK